MSDGKILLVDDEPKVLAVMKRLLKMHAWDVFTANSAREGLETLDRIDINVVVSDESMPGMSGTEFLSQVRTKFPQIIRIILTGHAGLETAINAINEGEVYRYFTKPCDSGELAAAIKQGLQQQQLVGKSRQLLHEHQKRSAVLEELERDNPGITRVDTDEEGAIFLETMEIELDDLLKRFE